MKRDGATTSLWQQDLPDYVSRTLRLPDQSFDVIIAGGGVTGIATALQLQLSGKKCLVLEAHRLCFGTTGGTTAHLNSFFDASYYQVKKSFGKEALSLLASAAGKALDLYRTNIETHAIDCGYAQKDGYLFSQTPEQSEALEKIFEASLEAGVDVSRTDRIPLSLPFEKAIVYREQAQIHPSQYVLALARVFEENGGILLQDCSVEDVVEAEGRVTVATSKGGVQATYLVYATHIPQGINFLHFRCAPYRSYAMAVQLKGACPEDLSYDMAEPYHYYRTAEIQGEKFLIGGGEDHKTGHVDNTEACFSKLEAHLRKNFEVDRVHRKWSSQYFQPADGLPYIGLMPGSQGNILVATGYGGNGMTYSHVAALLLTDLIHHKENAHAALFNPNRIKPVAGFSNFVKENADVISQFVEKRISIDKLQELAGMAAGEGRVVKYEGEKLGIYRDEGGVFHAINPVCTHARCLVQWNTAEKSWDCPCHGARYSAEGKVLTGPARKDLQIVQLSDLVVK